MALRSSSFSPVYNTNPDTNNLQVEIIGGSFINLGSSSTTSSSTFGGSTTNSANSLITNVTSTNVSTTLLTANANRNTVLIVNNSLSDMYILLNSSVVNSVNYTVLLNGKSSDSDNPSNISFEGSDYTGEVRGLWSFIDGSAQITEVTGVISIVPIPNDLQLATAFTASTVCLNVPLVETPIALTSVKIIAMESRTNTAFRFSTTSGNTINTQNFEAISTGKEYYQDGINFTGSFFFSAETLPIPTTVLACATTNGSANVTSTNSFNSVVIGQAVTGIGIPANTFVIRRAVDNLSITLGNASGTTVNATATDSVTLTFSGAVIRISRWT